MDFLFEPWHLIVLAVILGVLYFSGPKVPEMSRSLGKSLRIFKSELKNVKEDVAAADPRRDSGSADAVGGTQERALPAATWPPEQPRTVAARQPVGSQPTAGIPQAGVPADAARPAGRARPRPAPRPPVDPGT